MAEPIYTRNAAGELVELVESPAIDEAAKEAELQGAIDTLTQEVATHTANLTQAETDSANADAAAEAAALVVTNTKQVKEDAELRLTKSATHLARWNEAKQLPVPESQPEQSAEDGGDVDGAGESEAVDVPVTHVSTAAEG